MASPILWQNKDRTVTLFDIPCSIEDAQQFSPCYKKNILTSPAIQHPFPSTEPKSAVAKDRVKSQAGEDKTSVDRQNLLGSDLHHVKQNHSGDWCLPRPFSQVPSRRAKKRRLDDESTINQPVETSSTDHIDATLRLDGVLQDIATGSDGQCYGLYFERGENEESRASNTTSHSNTSHNTQRIVFRQNGRDIEPLRFWIPPLASFHIGDCSDARVFRATIRKHLDPREPLDSFNLILMDPPWPNKSVKRTHQTPGSTYQTPASMWDVRELLLDSKVDLLMAEDCLVGVWITHKPAVRELILGDDGLFDYWDVQLEEEWIWLKTTSQGKPVTSLDAVWRRPYEVLLLGRKRKDSSCHQENNVATQDVKRRVIVAVPDLHSRKPCLKALIEPLIRNEGSYRVLEVFARHLVAGWWSWGNECLKFNWEGYWQSVPDLPPTKLP
jgi:N6-adenosine-specific RNA methylase IME4